MQYWVTQSTNCEWNTLQWNLMWENGCLENISTDFLFVEKICTLFNKEEVEPCHAKDIVEDLLAQGAWNEALL